MILKRSWLLWSFGGKLSVEVAGTQWSPSMQAPAGTEVVEWRAVNILLEGGSVEYSWVYEFIHHPSQVPICIKTNHPPMQ